MELGAYYSEELQYIALNIQSQKLCVIMQSEQQTNVHEI